MIFRPSLTSRGRNSIYDNRRTGSRALQRDVLSNIQSCRPRRRPGGHSDRVTFRRSSNRCLHVRKRRTLCFKNGPVNLGNKATEYTERQRP